MLGCGDTSSEDCQGVETLLLKTARVGLDIPEDNFQAASPEKTQYVMLMRTCGQMQERGRTRTFTVLYSMSDYIIQFDEN